MAPLALLGSRRIVKAAASYSNLVILSILNQAAGLVELLAGAGRMDSWKDILDCSGILKVKQCCLALSLSRCGIIVRATLGLIWMLAVPGQIRCVLKVLISPIV